MLLGERLFGFSYANQEAICILDDEKCVSRAFGHSTLKKDANLVKFRDFLGKLERISRTT